MTLRAESVSLRFGSNRVLSDVSIEVRCGAVTVLAGPNGAGKSSLLRLLGGELEPDNGSVHLNDRPLTQFSPAEQARHRSVMTQTGPMAFDFHVEEILAMGWTRSNRTVLHAAVARIVDDCDIGHLLGRKFNSLSGGERQRVQFARALLQIWRPRDFHDARTFPNASDQNTRTRMRTRGSATTTGAMSGSAGGGAAPPTRYVLLDEPTASLDLAHELLVLRLARRASRDNIGVLIVLHDLNLAARFADHVVLLVDGLVAAAGRPADVFTNATLSGAYRTAIQVEKNERAGRLVVHVE